MASDTVLIQGDTFPVKDRLKALGGKWDATARGWRDQTERAAEAKELVEAAGRDKGSRMRGELWQPCDRRYCDNEPVCSRCELCEKHCTC